MELLAVGFYVVAISFTAIICFGLYVYNQSLSITSKYDD